MNIEWIRKKVKSGAYILSAHAEEERQQDEILIRDIDCALLHGEVIEYYSGDPAGSRCLVLGHGEDGRPIHLVVGRTKEQNLVVVTVYIPSKPTWIDPETRRKK